MPNYVMNNVRIIAEKDEIERFIKECFDEYTINFNAIVPEPEKIEDCPDEYIDRGDAHVEHKDGRDWFDWYSWHCDKWGTKWPADEGWRGEPELLEGGKYLFSFSFCTAWSTPVPIFEAIDDKYNFEYMRCEYADESLGYNCGWYDASHIDGVDSYEEEFADHMDDAYQWACCVWGWDPMDEEI